MMTSSKPLASLSSGLLARKGQARPAMRPQGFHGSASMNLEDLGWNDMGDATVEAVEGSAQVVAIAEPAHTLDAVEAVVPPVLTQREDLAAQVATIAPVAASAPAENDDVRTISSATAQRIQREVKAKKAKSAFTLRLDADRHLRLRLASATRGRSAQHLVTEALDAFMSTLPEVEGLVAQLAAAPKGSRGK